jgi:hypothetical protein
MAEHSFCGKLRIIGQANDGEEYLSDLIKIGSPLID